MNIVILHSQVPFVTGGAEVLVQGLAAALSDAGHDVDVVALPLSWNPPEGLLTTALAWRLLDLSSFNGRTVDRVICTKYPTWAVKHPDKYLWLIHQHRQAYDLYGSSMSEFTPDAASHAIRERVVEIDRIGINECVRRFAISANVGDRLKRYSGLDAATLYPPVPRSGLAPVAFEPFVLSVARLDAAKRVLDAVNAWEHVTRDLKLVVVGDGPDRECIQRRVEVLGLQDRVSLLGRVDDERLRDLYNSCRAVYYAPVDEDYGYTAVESLAAGKPVVTAPDSGGVLEFVRDGETGVVSALDPTSLASALGTFQDEAYARRLGASGPSVTAPLTWDTIVAAMTASSPIGV